MALTAQEEALIRQLLDQQAAILSLAGNEATITSKLGATKVTLADLVAANAVADADLLLTRQGTTDKSVRADILAAYMAAELNLSSLAPKASPVFTGNPTAPTAAAGTNTTQMATTAFVQSQIASSVPAASEIVAGKVELATAAETTTGTDNTRAVHPAGLKVELDKKAPLASPALTGTPTAPTAAAGTNTTQMATTAFVQRALGNFQSVSGTAVSTSLAAADGGKAYTVYGASPFTLKLPPQGSVTAPGWAITIISVALPLTTIAAQGTDVIDGTNPTAPVASITIGYGESVTLVYQGGGKYFALGANSANMKQSPMFGSSLAANGYQKLPSGLIIQWGRVTCSTSGPVNWTYPLTFPNQVLCVGHIGVLASSPQFATIADPDLVKVPVSAWNFNGTRSSNDVLMLAIGY